MNYTGKLDANGLNWWQRNRKKIFATVAAFAVGGPIAAALVIIEEFLNGNGFARTYETPLTSQEEIALDSFIDNKFIPFFNRIITLVDGAIINTDTTSRTLGNPVIVNINTARKQIAILKKWLQHTTTYPPTGYTANMIEARNGFINEHLDILNKAITDYLVSKNVTTTGYPETIDVIAQRETFGMNYTWATSRITTVYSKLNEAQVVQNLTTDPVEIVIPDVVADAIQTVSTATNNTPTAKSSSNIFWKAAAVVGIAVAIFKKK